MMARVSTGPNLPRGLVTGTRRNLPFRRVNSSGPGSGNLPSPLAVSSPAAMTGGVSAAAGGVIDPNWRPPVAPPPYVPPPPTPSPAPPPTNRTFQDPRRPSDDPRIADLLRALTEAGKTPGTPGVTPLDLSSVNAKSAQLQALSAALMRGEGIATPDLSNDHAAQAFALTKRREEERAREAEAAALGASGVAGSGDFDARVAQLREQAGQSIAANNAELTNKRPSEARGTAMSGAQLNLSDLDRQTRGLQAEHETRVEQQRIQEAKNAAARGDRLALLQILMQGDKGKQDAFERERDRIAAERRVDLQFQREQTERRFQEARQREQDRIREELARLDLERAKRENEREKGRGDRGLGGRGGGLFIPGGNTYGTNWGVRR